MNEIVRYIYYYHYNYKHLSTGRGWQIYQKAVNRGHTR